MRDYVDGLHDMTPEERNRWPKYLMRKSAMPWGDGVLFLQCPGPNHMRGVSAHMEVVWERRGPQYDFGNYLLYGMTRRQVSALYALTRAAIIAGTIK